MHLQTHTPARRTAAVAKRPDQGKPHPAKRVLFMKEIERRYSGEWVLIINPVVDKLTRVQRGEVVVHHPDRDEVYKVAHARRDRSAAIFYVGALPKDLVVVLSDTRSIQRPELS